MLYLVAPISKASPPENLASKARLNVTAASALSIAIKSLSRRLRPDAKKFLCPNYIRLSAPLRPISISWRFAMWMACHTPRV